MLAAGRPGFAPEHSDVGFRFDGQAGLVAMHTSGLMGAVVGLQVRSGTGFEVARACHSGAECPHDMPSPEYLNIEIPERGQALECLDREANAAGTCWSIPHSCSWTVTCFTLGSRWVVAAWLLYWSGSKYTVKLPLSEKLSTEKLLICFKRKS